MKTKILFVTVIFSLLISCPGKTYSQLNISLGPAIGLTTPAADLSGNASDYYLGNKYGMKSSVNFGAMGKLGLGPFGFNLSIIYSPMSNSGVADPSFPNSNADVSMHILTIGIGSDIGFGVPLSPVRPYIGLDLLLSSIGGSVKFQGISNVNSSSIDIQSAFRTGLGIAGGVQIKFGGIKLDGSIRYNMLNLFSKNYDGSSTGTRDQAYSFLNDAKDPNYSTDPNGKHPIGGNRSINTVQFELGVMFGFK